MTNLQAAAQEYLARKTRETRPDGKFDSGGRWYPSNEEECECCNAVRSPSRSYPYSLMIHCRTAIHVANLFDVNYKDLIKEVKSKRKC